MGVRISAACNKIASGPRNPRNLKFRIAVPQFEIASMSSTGPAEGPLLNATPNPQSEIRNPQCLPSYLCVSVVKFPSMLSHTVDKDPENIV
jgi:hypothetical protein